MECGVGPDVTEPWVHASQAAASLGISRKSVCRARSVVSNAIQYFEQLSWSEALASVEASKFVTGKFGWDETGLRVMMPNERVQELFEELKCDDMPDDDEEKADQEAQDIDAALADGGGRKGMSRVLLQIMQKKLIVCAGGIEGAITPSRASCGPSRPVRSMQTSLPAASSRTSSFVRRTAVQKRAVVEACV